MKKKKILKIVSVILSIMFFLLDICLFIKLYKNGWQTSLVENPYERGSLLISSLIQFGTLIYGIGLILIVWIEYFFINILLKFNNKFKGLKKILLILTLLMIITILIIIGIKILILMLRVLI